jgi:DNA-binding MarR family transcriptional regulator
MSMTVEGLRAEPATAAATTPAGMACLAFRLAEVGATVGAQVDRTLRTTGLGVRHNLALLRLARGAMPQHALSGELGVDPSVLVSILNCLEREGLATRRRDPTDRRRHIVEITERGADVVHTIERALGAFEAELFADLSEAETGQLRELLTRVRIQPDPGACAAD